MKTIKKRIGLLSLIALLLASMLFMAACNDESNRDEDKTTASTQANDTSTPDDDTGNKPDDTGSTPADDTDNQPNDTGSTPGNDTSNTPNEPVVPANPTYTVKVVDQNGNPVEGVKIQLCDSITGTCNPQRTKSDANGLVTITTLPDGDYYASALSTPEGYTVDPDAKGYFDEDNYTEVVVTAAE